MTVTSFLRYLACVCLLRALAVGGPIAFSTDIASTTGFAPSDILMPGPALEVSGASLGLSDADILADFSYGNDNPRASAVRFAVDRVAVGVPGSAVNALSTAGGANANIFAARGPGLGHGLFLKGSSLGLTAGFFGDDITGLSLLPRIGDVYFALGAGSPGLAGGSAARIFVSSPGSIFASASDLGIDPLDELDGLALRDAGRIGVLDPGLDFVLFSITTFSASAVAMGGPLSPATIYQSHFDGSFSTYLSYSDLGLLEDDELHGIAAIPEPATFTLASIALCAFSVLRLRGKGARR